MFGFRGAGSGGGGSLVPDPPEDDGDYALRVAGGVASWVRTPLFVTVGVTDGTNELVFANDPNDATRMFLDSPLRVSASVMTGNYYATSGGYTIIDDNGNQHAVAFLDDDATPTELQLGNDNESALVTRWQGNGLVMKSGAGAVGSADPGSLIVSIASYVYGTIGDDFDLTADGNWRLATQTGPVFSMNQGTKAIQLDAGATGPITINGGAIAIEGQGASHFSIAGDGLILSSDTHLALQSGGELNINMAERINITQNSVTPWEIWAGSGSPEGVVTAPAGSTYQDITNGEMYLKNSGAGNTGWKLITHA